MDVAGETDLERLRQLAKAQDSELKRVGGLLRELTAEVARLKGVPVNGELALLESKLNGDKPQPAPSKARQRRKRARKKRKPHTSPTTAEQHCLLSADEQECDSCVGALSEMTDMTEDSELIDVIDVEYVLKRVKRQKYSCRCGAIKTAPGPARTRVGGRYSLDFGIKVAIDKYLHHLPLERQVRMMHGAGLRMGSNTLWNQVEAISALAAPTWDALRRAALREGIIGLDQTGWPNLDARHKKKWQMWSITTPNVVYHTIRDDKSAATFGDLVGGYSGYIVCDDLSSHDAGARGSPDIVLVGCWAHIYRKFEEASGDFPQAEEALRLIRWLYDVDHYSPPDKLGENRAKWSKLVLDELYAWMTTVPVLLTTTLGKAIKHTLKIKDRLRRIVDDPHVWLDNNPTERSLRGPVVGRRNHFGSKSRDGTRAAAILYSIVETAKLNDVDPSAYLREIAKNARLVPGAVTMPSELKVRAGSGGAPKQCRSCGLRRHDGAARGLTFMRHLIAISDSYARDLAPLPALKSAMRRALTDPEDGVVLCCSRSDGESTSQDEERIVRFLNDEFAIEVHAGELSPLDWVCATFLVRTMLESRGTNYEHLWLTEALEAELTTQARFYSPLRYTWRADPPVFHSATGRFVVGLGCCGLGFFFVDGDGVGAVWSADEP